ATLVARGAPTDAVFSSATEEVGRLLSVDGNWMLRYESDDTATVVAYWGDSGAGFPPGARAPLDGRSIPRLVLDEAQPVRIDGLDNVSGVIGAFYHEWGVHSAVGAPIMVDGHLWGAMAALSRTAKPLPLGSEQRLAYFTDLVATAIANTIARAELAAS